ncbi:MAG: hypothetical protein K0R71_1112 [Bacillales bacterium]|jgi:uncharacterized membrane protein YraQ (UPF0718 family)|nr:hypothetical protein [Bacillales bacterium]
MTARWREGLFLGVIAFLFTYLFTSINNNWQMSLFRAGIGFLLFSLLGYILQILIHLISSQKSTSLLNEETRDEVSEQNDFQNIVDIDQKNDPLFQEVNLGSLHNGDSNH